MKAMSTRRPGITALIFGGVSLIGLIGFCFYWWSSRLALKSIKNDKDDEETPKSDYSNIINGEGCTNQAKKSSAVKERTDDATATDGSSPSLQQQYDDAIRLAK